MKNKKVGVVLICLLFVYVILSLLNSLYWSGFDDDSVITSVGSITDGVTLEALWIPGQLLGFFLGIIVGEDVTLIGSLLTFLIGALLLMRFFKLSLSDIVHTRKISE
jgi:hypothetical protein